MITKYILLFVCFIFTAWQIVVRCSCEQVFWEAECIAAGCFWRNDICILIQCENRISKTECKQLTATSDLNPNCQWIGSDDEGKCMDIDESDCQDTDCNNTLICELDQDEKCQVKNDLEQKSCGSFGSLDCSQKLKENAYCEKHANGCTEVNYDTKCSDILTEKACSGLGCAWNTTKKICNPKDCIFYDQPNCTWTINSNRTFTFCEWNETRAFCQEQNQTNVFTNIERCSLDSNFTYHFDNTTGNNECQACVDPAELSYEVVLKYNLLALMVSQLF